MTGTGTAPEPVSPHDVIARLMKAVETSDCCELKPEEAKALLGYIGDLQLYGLNAAAEALRGN